MHAAHPVNRSSAHIGSTAHSDTRRHSNHSLSATRPTANAPCNNVRRRSNEFPFRRGFIDASGQLTGGLTACSAPISALERVQISTVVASVSQCERGRTCQQRAETPRQMADCLTDNTQSTAQEARHANARQLFIQIPACIIQASINSRRDGDASPDKLPVTWGHAHKEISQYLFSHLPGHLPGIATPV